MKNKDNKNVVDSHYIDPKTGSGYVPAGKGNMDFSIALVIGIILVAIVGGGILLFTNEDVKEGFNDFIEGFVDAFEDDYEEDEDEDYIDDYEDKKEDKEDKYDDNDHVSYSIKGFKEIKASDIYNESKGKTIVLWIGRQSCGFCAIYAPVIEDVADDYDIVARYIDLGKIINFNVSQPYISDQDSYNLLENLSGSGEWQYFASENINATPLTLIIRDNKVIGGVSGFVGEDVLEGIFNAAGLRD